MGCYPSKCGCVCVTVLDKYHWGFGVTTELQRWFWWLQLPSWLSPPHPPLCLTLTHASALTLCVSDTVCYTSRMPESSVPTSAGTGDVWSIPLSPGNRHVRSPPPGADAGAEGREWVETSRYFFYFFFLVISVQTNADTFSNKDSVWSSRLSVLRPVINVLCINQHFSPEGLGYETAPPGFFLTPTKENTIKRHNKNKIAAAVKLCLTCMDTIRHY